MAVSVVQKISSISQYPYHAFLSFRGADTRKNFTDHLYTALMQAGIRTFRDENEIERGENIRDKIHRAILQESKISLIVFSKNYASSTWCLDELAMILEQRKSSGFFVLPIFYDIDPSHVRNQSGSFAEAFAKHEDRMNSEIEKVKRWRAALREVADLGGMVLQDRHESQFIRDIVRYIQNKFIYNGLYVPPCLVGVDFLVTCISWWLQNATDKVAIATICGIRGIGKTTIAKVVYNLHTQRFQGYSFLANVREMSEQPNGLLHLQRQLISAILKSKANKIYNADDGIIKIKQAICTRKVLIVLDDVDDLNNITKLIGTQVSFHPGSKILVTTRHRHLLSNPFVSQLFDVDDSSSYGDFRKVFEVKELGFDESLQLFNWHAFGSTHVSNSYKEYAVRAVEHCAGLPLALQILGSSLSGKSIHVWKSALEKLEAFPSRQIQRILKISYDSLQDDHDKNLFLDIVCLFVGKDRDYVTTILDSCDFYTTIGIENLIDRCLLTVNEKNKIMMHQTIRDMGREIIREESKNPWIQSRLWQKDAFNVLREKSGTNTIRCLGIDLEAFLAGCSNEIKIETEAFSNMHNLKLLQMDYVKLQGDYKNLPKGLIWLRWHGFSLESLPLDFDIERLVVLDMRNSNLKHVWKNTKCLPHLKILNLNHSHGLLKTPNFSGLHNLEKLMLKECIKLTEVDQTIGELKSLTFLNLKGCQSLMKLPRTIGSLESMEELILCGCSRLNHLPEELRNIKTLKVLNLDETAIYESDSWFSWLLSPMRSKELGFSWACLPSSLVKLSLESCRLSDDVIPDDLSNLVSLKCLNLSRNPIHSLPESICMLTKLDELLLTGCTELRSLQKLQISSINGFHAKNIQALDVVTSVPYLLSFKKCVIFGCESLSEVKGVFKLEPIENFDEEQIKSLFSVDSIQTTKVQIYNYLTDAKIFTTPQVLQECGITSCFVPGNEVPTSFEHRYEGYKIWFSLPPCSGEKIRWLNLCIAFSFISYNILDFLPRIEITNKTKGTKWAYFSSLIGVPKTSGDTMLWLIHWPVNHHQLEGGDELGYKIWPSEFQIKEFGFSCGFESESVTYQLCDFPYSYPGKEDNIAGNVNLEILEEFLLSLSGNIKVQIYNRLKDSHSVISPQVLYDCNIIGTFELWPDIPFMTQCRYHVFGSKICFTMPQNSSCRPKSILLTSVVKLFAADDIKPSEFLLHVDIVNETKNTKWTYFKSFVGFTEAKSTMIWWLNSWKFMGDEFESGDRISFNVMTGLGVMECGINLIYEPDGNAILYSYFYFLVGISISILFGCQRNLYRRMNSIVSE